MKRENGEEDSDLREYGLIGGGMLFVIVRF